MYYIKMNLVGLFIVIEKWDIVFDVNVLEIVILKLYGYLIKLEFIDYRSVGYNVRFKCCKLFEFCNVCYFIFGEVFYIG